MRAIIRNTCIVVTDYTPGKVPGLEKYFTIFDPLTHTYKYVGVRFDEEKKLMYLPRGVDTGFIARTLGVEMEREYNSDPYEQTTMTTIKYMPRDDVQKEALRFILAKGEYMANSNRTQLSVNLNTGAGKTYVTIAAMAYWNVKICVIASNKAWLEQWQNCVAEYTNTDIREVLIITGAAAIHKILKGFTDLSKYKAFMVTHSTLKNFGERFGWDSIGELFKKLNVYMKVFDEAHLNFENIASIDYATNTKKTLYLTATPIRSNSDENTIYKLYFKNVPKIDLFDADNDPHTRYHAILYNSRPTPQMRANCYNYMYGLDRNKYMNSLVNTEEFRKIMLVMMDKILRIGGKVLVYIGTNQAIEEIKVWIEENYPEYRGDVGIFTSTYTQAEKQIALSKTIILSTTKSAGAALDIRGLKATFVLNEPFKSEVLARQTLGRTRNDDTDYIEFVDTGFTSTRQYYRAKKPIFKKYASDCKEIQLDFNTLNNKAEELELIRENVKAQYEANRMFIDYRATFDINSVYKKDKDK